MTVGMTTAIGIAKPGHCMSDTMGIDGYMWGQWPLFNPMSTSLVGTGRPSTSSATDVASLQIRSFDEVSSPDRAFNCDLDRDSNLLISSTHSNMHSSTHSDVHCHPSLRLQDFRGHSLCRLRRPCPSPFNRTPTRFNACLVAWCPVRACPV